MSRKIPIALPYQGGKAHIAEWVISHFPAHKKYIEPFAGGASVLINKRPVPTEVYNDIDGEVVNFFSVLRNRGDELTRVLEMTPYAHEEYEDALIFDANDDELELARKTVVKAMFSFNGRGFRAVQNNNTSAPKRFSEYVHGLGFVIDRFRGVTIENRDALELIKLHDSVDTLHYFDPPYVGTDNYENNYSDDDHRALADVAKDLDGMVIISGYPSALYDELYPEELFRKVYKSVNAGSITKGSMRTECLWISRNVSIGLFDDMGGW